MTGNMLAEAERVLAKALARCLVGSMNQPAHAGCSVAASEFPAE